MKKISKIITSVLLILVLSSPLFLSGCDLIDKLLNNGGEVTPYIEIHTDFLQDYYIGDDYDVTNGKINYTNSKGETMIVEVQRDMISSFNTSTIGQRQMIITYQNCTMEYEYTVSNRPDLDIGYLYYCTDCEEMDVATLGNLYILFSVSDNNVTCYTITSTYTPSTGTMQQIYDSGRVEIVNSDKSIVKRQFVYTFTNQYATIKVAVVSSNELKCQLTQAGTVLNLTYTKTNMSIFS